MKSKLSVRDFSMVIALILIWGFFAIMSNSFLSPRNLSLLAIELSITAVLALGMLIILLPNQIDLSVGSGVGLLGGIAAVLIFHYHLPAFVALLISTIIGVVIWTLLGRLIVKSKVPAFIVTLGGLLIFKGLHWLIINNATVPVVEGGKSNIYSLLTTYYLPPAAGYVLVSAVVLIMFVMQYRAYNSKIREGQKVEDKETMFLKLFLAAQFLLILLLITNQYRGIPLSVVILGAVALIVYLITQHTPYGRYLYAIGGNQEAAFVSGIAVDKVVIGAFTIMGFIVALTGFMQTAYAGASTTTLGNLMELDAIAACVIGGTSLRGGQGSVIGVLFGALIMASLLNGMTLMAISPEIKYIARGTVLTLAVWMDIKLSNR